MPTKRELAMEFLQRASIVYQNKIRLAGAVLVDVCRTDIPVGNESRNLLHDWWRAARMQSRELVCEAMTETINGSYTDQLGESDFPQFNGLFIRRDFISEINVCLAPTCTLRWDPLNRKFITGADSDMYHIEVEDDIDDCEYLMAVCNTAFRSPFYSSWCRHNGRAYHHTHGDTGLLENGNLCHNDDCFTCDRCGNVYDNNESHRVDGDHWCQNCVDNHSYWCEDCEERHSNDDDCPRLESSNGWALYDYHRGPRRRSLFQKKVPGPHVGFEFECVGDFTEMADALDEAGFTTDDLVAERDSTVDVEWISRPVPVASAPAFAHRFASALKGVAEAYDAEKSCGCHMNFDKDIMGDRAQSGSTFGGRIERWDRLVKLMYKHYVRLARFSSSRRNLGSYARAYSTLNSARGDGHAMLNWRGDAGHCEIRLAAMTINADSLYTQAKLYLNLIANVKAGVPYDSDFTTAFGPFDERMKKVLKRKKIPIADWVPYKAPEARTEQGNLLSPSRVKSLARHLEAVDKELAGRAGDFAFGKYHKDGDLSYVMLDEESKAYRESHGGSAVWPARVRHDHIPSGDNGLMSSVLLTAWGNAHFAEPRKRANGEPVNQEDAGNSFFRKEVHNGNAWEITATNLRIYHTSKHPITDLQQETMWELRKKTFRQELNWEPRESAPADNIKQDEPDEPSSNGVNNRYYHPEPEDHLPCDALSEAESTYTPAVA